MIATPVTYQVTWEKLPDDYILPNDPVDNIHQPCLAAALTESLELAHYLPPQAFTSTNYGICATVNGKMVIKAPDWCYVRAITVPRQEIIRSYTPQLQGEIPLLVMEFLSDTEGHEYSNKPTYPPGKWFFYEQILRVPNYVIFDPQNSQLEVYHLIESGHYELQTPNPEGRYWIAEMNLELGPWEGTRENRTGYWLRWWNETGELLQWGTERVQQAQEQVQQAQEQAQQERQRADRLAARLQALGIDLEALENET